LTDILRINTKLFRNCLEGMSDEQANVRPSAAANNAIFVAAHVADSRYFLLKVLGADLANPLAPYLEKAKSIDDVKRFPALSEIQSAWTAASRSLRDRIGAIPSAEWDVRCGERFPAADQTMIGALTFLVQHDSYHVGQLALLRRQVGLPAMSYT
jgi:uncharacterized damage-inducible protein DinB